MVSFEGKDVWLVQVPTGFDASKATVKSETEIKAADGAVYSLEPTFAPLGVCQILESDEKDSSKADKNLHVVSTKPIELMALTQTVSVPKVDYSKVIIPKPRVKQHQGLRLRHYPSGYGNTGSVPMGITKDKAALKSPKKVKAEIGSGSSSKSSSKEKKEKKDKKSKKEKSEKKEKKDKKASS